MFKLLAELFLLQNTVSRVSLSGFPVTFPSGPLSVFNLPNLEKDSGFFNIFADVNCIIFTSDS